MSLNTSQNWWGDREQQKQSSKDLDTVQIFIFISISNDGLQYYHIICTIIEMFLDL